LSCLQSGENHSVGFALAGAELAEGLADVHLHVVDVEGDAAAVEEGLECWVGGHYGRLVVDARGGAEVLEEAAQILVA